MLALALAKRTEDRFEDAIALADALRHAARGALDPALRARADRLLASARHEGSGFPETRSPSLVASSSNPAEP